GHQYVLAAAQTEEKRPTQTLRQEDQAQVLAQEPPEAATGREPGLRRAPRHTPISGLRLTMASGRSTGALRGCAPPFPRLLPADVHRHFLRRHRDHSPLWTALQARPQLQTGTSSDRLV